MRSNNVKTQSTSVKGINHKQRVKFCQNIKRLSPPLAPVTVVPTAATLLTKLLSLVLVPSVLQVLSRVFQELVLLLSLKQGAHNSHAFDLHLVFCHPSSSRSFGTALCFETDLCLCLPLLIPM